MIRQTQLPRAPRGFTPNCSTQHIAGDIVQVFPGGKVRMVYSQSDNAITAYVNGKEVGRWEEPTIEEWSAILYHLQVNFRHMIVGHEESTD